MRIFKDVPDIKFMKIRNYGFMVSGTIIAIGIILFFIKGFNMGIDFTGGTSMDISFKDYISISDVRGSLEKIGMGKSVIQQVGKSNRFIIKIAIDTKPKGTQNINAKESETHDMAKRVESTFITEEETNLKKTKSDLNNTSHNELVGLLISKGVPRDTAEETFNKLEEFRKNNVSGLIHNFGELEQLDLKKQALTVLKDSTFLGRMTFLSVESIGPQVGKDMRTRAFWATVLSLLGMLVYIAVRFRFMYGISGVLTLVHDTLVVLTFILAFQIEFSLSVLAAILTLIGYSINDTIVVFDRLRDNVPLMRRQKLEVILDTSINQTLSRTVITAGTVFLTVIALFFFGGEVIHAFSATLLVGVIVGTYSSIYQSCAYLMVWEKQFIKNIAKKK
jgi:preprotein translocase subunit SecF